MKRYALISSLVFLTSCLISFEINENGYRSLSESEKKRVKPFSEAVKPMALLRGDNLSIFEIDTRDIRTLIDSQKYTWIHLWAPYCPAEKCVNIKPFENLENKYKDKGLNLTFISVVYRFDPITEIVNNTGFSKVIYVLKSNYYGIKTREICKKLHFDLSPDSKPDDYFGYNDYVFEADRLIYMGNEINETIIDSLMNR